MEEKRNSLKFRDGERQIDFVLVYGETEDPKKKERRETFEQNLQEEGLELEYEDKKVSLSLLFNTSLYNRSMG